MIILDIPVIWLRTNQRIAAFGQSLRINAMEQAIKPADAKTPLPEFSGNSATGVRPEIQSASSFKEGDALFGRYRLVQKLGSGAQGEVWRAKTLKEDADVAIKMMYIQSVKNWKMYELFFREAQALQSLNIPGVAKFYEAVEDLEAPQPVSVIVQEYIHGMSLARYIASGHRFLLSEIADIVIQLLDILDKIHNNVPSVIHRDVKPSNIMLQDIDGNHKVWLIDFGAVANPQVKDGGSTLAGTYGYMAPEQLMGKPVASSDFYSLGVLAFYLLSGVPPEQVEVQDFRLLIDRYLEHLPFGITVLLRNMLAPRLDERLSHPLLIKAAFIAIKKNRFDDLAKLLVVKDDKPKIPSDTGVLSYKESGCIELWDGLSDSVPRVLDECTMRRIKKSVSKITPMTFDVLGHPQQLKKEWKQVKRHAKKRPKTPESERIFTMSGGFATLAPCDWVPLLLSYLRVTRKVVSPNRLFLMSALVLVLLLVLTVQIWCWWRYFEFYQMMGVCAGILLCALCLFMAFRKFVLKYSGYFMKRFLPLLTYGRKTLATVSDIQYVLPHQKDECPLWHISYIFNPIDDSSELDLERGFYTHVPPDDLKVGDLIPALYMIACDDNHEEYVFSMPWPVLNGDEIYMSDDVEKLFVMNTVLTKDDILHV